VFDKVRNVAAVVNVRMRENDRAQRGRVKHERLIPVIGFTPSALEKPAFKQDFFTVHADENLRSGDRLRRTAELEKH
jgi:hypothetical protein